MRTTLVTGSAGQLGSYVVDMLCERGRPVLGLDRRPSRWTNIVADVRTHGAAPAGVGAIVHCAAQVSVPLSVASPREDAAENVDGTLAMLEAARSFDARFVFISSAAVYGDPSKTPIREDSPVEPVNPYGLSKAVGERYTNLYARLYGLETVILRPFNVFSPRADPSSPYSGVVTQFVRAVSEGRPPVLHGGGLATRDFVHATDVSRAVLLALSEDRAKGGTFNVGTGRPTSIRDLAALVVKLAGSAVRPVDGEARRGDIAASVADVSRLVALGHRPATDLPRQLGEIVAQGAIP
ncbi:MAG TPA: NAD-dependent epimerase/dehydratase family protein [Candidatus Thermoplasmatota archaeon]|nr:NAD-dependent epimerase/dehydratase family protein [Candidatus Thermoplasmatota archaeon]